MHAYIHTRIHTYTYIHAHMSSSPALEQVHLDEDSLGRVGGQFVELGANHLAWPPAKSAMTAKATMAAKTTRTAKESLTCMGHKRQQ